MTSLQTRTRLNSTLKPLCFSKDFESVKKMGCPFSKFIPDAYSQFVIKNPDTFTIEDFMKNIDPSIPRHSSQWISTWKYLSGYTAKISQPIHPGFQSQIKHHKSSRIFSYISEIIVPALQTLSHEKTPYQLDVFFIPSLIDKFNAEYFRKHNVKNFEKISLKEFGGQYEEPGDFAEFCRRINIRDFKKFFNKIEDPKRFVMLIMSENIDDISMDEICIFEAPTCNMLPSCPESVYNELISWGELNAICVSFHQHKLHNDAVQRVHFSAMQNYNFSNAKLQICSTRLFKCNFLDVIAPFCMDEVNKMPHAFHAVTFDDPRYKAFVESYFPALKYLFDSKIEYEKPTDVGCSLKMAYDVFNGAYQQKTILYIDVYQQINTLISKHYHSLCTGSKYNDQFIKYIYENEFEDVPLEDILGSNMDPNDCTLLDFDKQFLVHPAVTIESQEELHEYIFYFLQCCYLKNSVPSIQYMLGKVPHLIREDYIIIQQTTDDRVAICDFLKIAENIITNPTQIQQIYLDDYNKTNQFMHLLKLSGFKFCDDTQLYIFNGNDPNNSQNNLQKVIKDLHNNTPVLSSYVERAFLNYNNVYAKYQNPPKNGDNTSNNSTTSSSNSSSIQSSDQKQATNPNQQNGNQQNNNNNDQKTNNNNDDDKDNNDDNKRITSKKPKKKKRESKKKRIQKFISDPTKMSKRVNKIKWHKVPQRVFTKKSKTMKLQLDITKMEFIKSLKRFISDATNNKLIQVLVGSNKRQPLYEYVWIVRLALDKLEHDINIGISVKYNDKLNDPLQFTAIYLDKESILKRHKLAVPSSHECHCLDDVTFGISNLIIHGQKIGKQNMDPFRQLVQELASKDCGITDEWKQKALDLLANHQHNTDDDEESLDTQSDITNITQNSINSLNVPPNITNIDTTSTVTQFTAECPIKSATPMRPYNTAPFNKQTAPLIPYYPLLLSFPPIPTAVNTTLPPLNQYMYNTYYPPIQLPTSGYIQTSNQRLPRLQFPLLPHPRICVS